MKYVFCFASTLCNLLTLYIKLKTSYVAFKREVKKWIFNPPLDTIIEQAITFPFSTFIDKVINNVYN